MLSERIAHAMSDLPTFCGTFLTIRTKSGELKPFELNRAQTYLHAQLEYQKRDFGRVRAVILKGRQQGCSTFVQGRFFHQVATQKGKRAFILTHELDATRNLFDMTKRFFDSLPAGLVPRPDTSSAKELNFSALNSGYGVGTAGNKSVGRSQTIQLFHGSEVAYWPHAEDHAKGILQAVPNESGTEIILESTANGIGNYFYDMWEAASSTHSQFQAIFIPWYWQPEYRLELKDDFCLTDEEAHLMNCYADAGLTPEHLFWRRFKLREFSRDFDTAVELFNVEYPLTANDAFRNPVSNRFIKAPLVMNARARDIDTQAPLVIGVDPAISDNDKTAIIKRRGRRAYDLETHLNLNTMQLVGVISRMIKKDNPVRVLIDSIGIGAGIVDRLRELGFDCVEGINVARASSEPDKFRNLRAEIWHTMREWLAQDLPVSIPDSDLLHGDLTSLGYKFDSNARLQIESKDELKRRGLKSPDTADALALTFAQGDYTETNHTQSFVRIHEKGLFI